MERRAKRSVLRKGQGVPIDIGCDVANRHEVKLLSLTLDSPAIARPLPTGNAQGLRLNRGSDYESAREAISARGLALQSVAGEEIKPKAQTPGRRARRGVVESCHCWLNRSRALLIRRSKKDENNLALLMLACGLIVFNEARTAMLGAALLG